MLGLTNPNRQKSYKISQRLSPKHAARGVVQSPYPIYSHGNAYLSKQLLLRAAEDPRLAHDRSWVRAPAPVGALCALFSLPSLPSSLGRQYFSHLPYHPCESVRVIVHHSLGLTNPNGQKSYKISQTISQTRRTWCCSIALLYPIYSHGKAYLSGQLLWRAAGDPRLACGSPGFKPRPRGGAVHTFFSTLPSFLLGEIVFLHLPLFLPPP